MMAPCCHLDLIQPVHLNGWGQIPQSYLRRAYEFLSLCVRVQMHIMWSYNFDTKRKYKKNVKKIKIQHFLKKKILSFKKITNI